MVSSVRRWIIDAVRLRKWHAEVWRELYLRLAECCLDAVLLPGRSLR